MEFFKFYLNDLSKAEYSCYWVCKNIYQFVHSDDLATACILAGDAKIDGIFNIGTNRFTMRDTLENLVRHAGSQSQVKSVPAKLQK